MAKRPSALAVLIAVASASMLAAAWGLVPRTAGWNLAFTSAAAAALAGMLSARAAAPAEQRDRWNWWTAAAAAWLAGQLFWDLFTDLGFPASPNLADAGWYAFAGLVIAGLLRAPGRSRAQRAVPFPEVSPLIAAALALIYAELWPDALASALPLQEQIAALAYPAVYVSAAMLTLQAMIGGSLRRVHGPGPRLVLFGIVMQAIAFIGWGGKLLEP